MATSRSLGSITLDLLLKLGGFTSGLQQAATQSQAAFNKMNANAKKSATLLDDTFKRIRRSIIATAATYVSVDAVRGIIAIADEYKRLENRLSLVTTSSAELAQVQQELFGIAQRTRTEFTAVADLYAKLALTGNDLGVSQQQILKFTEAVGNALAISGTSAQSARGALNQLSQGLAAGTFRAEEFNSVLEASPELIRTVARNIDRFRGNVGLLRKEVAESKFRSVEFFEAVQKGADELSRRVITLPVTPGQAFVQLQNSIKQAVAEADLTPLIDALVELRKVVEDPAFQKGFIDFIALVVKLAGTAAVAAAAIGTMVSNLSDAWTAVFGTELEQATVNIEHLREQLAALQNLPGGREQFKDEIEDVKRRLKEALELRKQLVGATAPLGSEIRTRALSRQPTIEKIPTIPGAEDDTGKKLEAARKSILDQITALNQQRAVLKLNAAETMRYRIEQGDLVEVFKTAGPAFAKYKQVLIEAAAALEQATAIESIEDQIAALRDQAAVLNLAEDAAFEYGLTHGKLAEELAKAGDAQARLTEEYRKARAELEQQQDIKRITEGMPDVEIALLEATGQALDAERRRIVEQWRELRQSLQDEIARTGDPILVQQLVKLDLVIQAQQFQAEANQIKSEIDKALDALGRQEQTIQLQVEAGVLSEIGGRKATIALHQQQAKVLQDLVDKYEAVADAAEAAGTPIPGLREEIAQLELQILQLQQSTNEFKKVFADAFETGMGDALADLALGVSSLEEAAVSFLKGINEELVRWAAEDVAAAIRDKLFKQGGLGDLFANMVGGLGGNGLEEIAVTAQRIPERAAEQAALTAAATALTTAGTTLVTGGASVTTGATALGTSAAALTAAGQSVLVAAQAMSAAAAKLAAAGGAGGGSTFTGTALSLLGLAEGGLVQGPGTGFSDSIPAWLSNREYVMPAKIVAKPGTFDLLEKLRKGWSIPKFASGGLVSVNSATLASYGGGQWSKQRDVRQTQTVQQNFYFNEPQSRATQMQVAAKAARGIQIAQSRNN